MKLGFYEKVLINGSTRFPEYNGQFGYVLGISEEDDRVYGYAVSMVNEQECVYFYPEELQGTGEFKTREDFYDPADVIHVRVDGDEGFIVE